MTALDSTNAAFRSGSGRDKFEYIYDSYKNLMLNKAYIILKDMKLAEDALYKSFLYIKKNIRLIDDPDGSRAVAFVVTVVRNFAFSISGIKPPETVFYKSDDDYNVLGVEDALYEMSASDIIKVVNRLGGINKNIFLLKYAYGLSVAKIARILGVAETNVAERLRGARRKLWALLARGGRN